MVRLTRRSSLVIFLSFVVDCDQNAGLEKGEELRMVAMMIMKMKLDGRMVLELISGFLLQLWW